jgi:predicted Zn-dependent protease
LKELLRAANDYFRARDVANAEQILKEAEVLAPSSADVFLSQAAIHFFRKDFAAAARKLEQAHKARPLDAEILFQLAVVKDRLNETAAAVESLTRAIELNSRHSGAKEMLERLKVAPALSSPS